LKYRADLDLLYFVSPTSLKICHQNNFCTIFMPKRSGIVAAHPCHNLGSRLKIRNPTESFRQTVRDAGHEMYFAKPPKTTGTLKGKWIALAVMIDIELVCPIILVPLLFIHVLPSTKTELVSLLLGRPSKSQSVRLGSRSHQMHRSVHEVSLFHCCGSRILIQMILVSGQVGSAFVRTPVIREVMLVNDPEGVDARYPGRKKIKRMRLTGHGTWEEINCDGHEKLGALALKMGNVGLPIYGMREKWSGAILHLVVLPNDRLAAAIGHVYLDFVEIYGGACSGCNPALYLYSVTSNSTTNYGR
jgi:hypothetical protein